MMRKNKGLWKFHRLICCLLMSSISSIIFIGIVLAFYFSLKSDCVCDCFRNFSTNSKISNPMTVVSFSFSFVSLAFVLLGFAINNFAKKENEKRQTLDSAESYEGCDESSSETKKDETDDKNKLNINIQIIEVICLERRGKNFPSLINIFNYPLLAKCMMVFFLSIINFAFAVFFDNYLPYIFATTLLIFALTCCILCDTLLFFADYNFCKKKSINIITKAIERKLDHYSKYKSVGEGSDLKRKYFLSEYIFDKLQFLNYCCCNMSYCYKIIKLDLLGDNEYFDLLVSSLLNKINLCIDEKFSYFGKTGEIYSRTHLKPQIVANLVTEYFKTCSKIEIAELLPSKTGQNIVDDLTKKKESCSDNVKIVTDLIIESIKCELEEKNDEQK